MYVPLSESACDLECVFLVGGRVSGKSAWMNVHVNMRVCGQGNGVGTPTVGVGVNMDEC